MIRCLRALFVFATVVAFGFSGLARAQIAPPITALALKDANSLQQNESTTVYNKAFWANHLTWGWSYYAAQPVAWAMDPANGAGQVEIVGSPTVTLNGSATFHDTAAEQSLASLVSGGATSAGQAAALAQLQAQVSALTQIQANTSTGPTAAGQATANAALAQIQANTATSPTSANQVAANTSLTAIAAAAGTQADTAPAVTSTSAANGSVVGLLKAIATRLFGTLSVSGTVACSSGCYQATQPVSNSGTFAVQNTAAIPSGANQIGYVILNPGSNVIGFVNSTGTFAVQNTAATPAGSNNIGSITGNAGYNETQGASLGSGNIFGSTFRGAPVWASWVGCRSYAANSGTLYLYETVAADQASHVVQTAGPAAGALDVAMRVRGGAGVSYACYFINGSTTQAIDVESSFTAN